MFLERLIYDRTNISRANQMNNFFFCDYCSSITQANRKLLDRIEYVYNDIQPYLHFQQKLQRYFICFKIKLYIAIVTITIISSFMFLVLMDVADFLNNMRYTYCSDSIFLMILTACAAIIAATGLCGFFAHTAEASGIPELKTVFSGTNYYNFLSIQTLWVKYFSSLFVKLSGLGMGYEGAFIHIQAIMGHNLLKLPYFRDKGTDHNEKIIISAGVCSAIVMAFGTPIGALLFTVEMYTSNFKVTNLIRYFISGTIAYLMFLVLQRAFVVKVNTPTLPKEYFYVDLSYFCVLGVLSGLISAAYNHGFSKFLMWKRNTKNFICSNRYLYAITATTIVAIIAFPHNFFRYGFRTILNELINNDDLHNPRMSIHFWSTTSGIIWELGYVFWVRIAMMFAFSSAAIPFGLMGPGIILGTVTGRMFGEFLKYYGGINTSAKIFAVAGAPAFLSAVTKSFSPLICVLEITGDLGLFFPMLITTTIAFIVHSTFSIGFYDLIISIRRLPYLASILPPSKASMVAAHIMTPLGEDKLSIDATILKLFELVSHKSQIFEFDYVPIVNPKNGKMLKYVSLKKCYNFLKDYRLDFDKLLNERKETMSFRLMMAIRGLLNHHGQYASVFMVRQMRNYLQHIYFKDGKFVMNSMARNNKEVAKLDQETRRSADFPTRHRQHDSARATYAFKRDTAHMEKENEAEIESNLQLLKELLSNVPVSFDDPVFEAETYPLIVNERTSLMKVHYLFLMLNVDIIWVENDDGELVGRITQDTFLQFKSDTDER